MSGVYVRQLSKLTKASSIYSNCAAHKKIQMEDLMFTSDSRMGGKLISGILACGTATFMVSKGLVLSNLVMTHLLIMTRNCVYNRMVWKTKKTVASSGGRNVELVRNFRDCFEVTGRLQ